MLIWQTPQAIQRRFNCSKKLTNNDIKALCTYIFVEVFFLVYMLLAAMLVLPESRVLVLLHVVLVSEHIYSSFLCFLSRNTNVKDNRLVLYRG